MRGSAGSKIGRNPPRDLIGRRGEILFEAAITSYASGKALFLPAFLGDKWPAIDYYVELLDVPDMTPYFFAQVKSTTAPLSTLAADLKIQATERSLARLYRLPGPTYLIGVHEPTRHAFVRSIHQTPTHSVRRIPLIHELTPANLDVLYHEVCDFWRSHPLKPAVSSFV